MGSGILVDIGTTTTDMIPLVDGKPTPVGLTDVGRLQSGELSYSGIWRTPLCAVAHSVPFREGYCSLAAELFATTLDIHLLLDHIPEQKDNFDTANHRPATKDAGSEQCALANDGDCENNEPHQRSGLTQESLNARRTSIVRVPAVRIVGGGFKNRASAVIGFATRQQVSATFPYDARPHPARGQQGAHI
jgi:hypothetical protein